MLREATKSLTAVTAANHLVLYRSRVWYCAQPSHLPRLLSRWSLANARYVAGDHAKNELVDLSRIENDIDNVNTAELGVWHRQNSST